MNLPHEIFGNVIVVHTPDELSEDRAEAFEEYVTTLDRKFVVLDLDGSEKLDSEGLTSLLNARDRLVEEQGNLKLCTTNPTNRKILEITRLDLELDVFTSIIDAVKSFR